MKPGSFEWLKRQSINLIVDAGTQLGIAHLIVRAEYSLCAYLEIPEHHPIASVDHYHLDLLVHGGLSYKGPLTAIFGRFSKALWFGWDYGHQGDVLFDRKAMGDPRCTWFPCTQWDVPMVLAEIEQTIPYYKTLLDLYDGVEIT